MNRAAVILAGDLQVGHYMSLWPPDQFLDMGGQYTPNPFQAQLWEWWLEDWQWAGKATKGVPVVKVFNGEFAEGVAFREIALVTGDEHIQMKAAIKACQLAELLCPSIARFATRGTEAHSGKSSKHDEAIAEALGCTMDATTKMHARYQMFLRHGGVTFDIAHHQSVAMVPSSEVTYIHREGVQSSLDVGRWNWPRADVVVRGHDHHYKCINTAWGVWELGLPSYMLWTPHKWRIRRGDPVAVGIVLVWCEDGRVFIEPRLHQIAPPSIEEVECKSQPNSGKPQSESLRQKSGEMMERLHKRLRKGLE